MTLPTTGIRHTVRARLVELLKAQPNLSGIQVVRGYPGDEIEGEYVWLDEPEGTLSPASIKAGRKHRDDEWTQPIIVFAGAAGQTMDEAEDRAAFLFAAVEDLFADEPTLDVEGLKWIGDAALRGPTTFRTTSGAVSAYVIEPTLHARYQ